MSIEVKSPGNKTTQHGFKSPSDTTIYSPGLRKIASPNSATIIDKISNFVEGIRLEERRRSIITPPNVNANQVEPGTSGTSSRTVKLKDTRKVEHRNREECDKEDPDRITDQLLVQAEKFKARIEAPKGNYNQLLMPYDYERLRSKFVKSEGLGLIDSEVLFLRNFDQDDEFFHVTSQIEPSL